jgi:hypothetical protein
MVAKHWSVGFDRELRRVALMGGRERSRHSQVMDERTDKSRKIDNVAIFDTTFYF